MAARQPDEARIRLILDAALENARKHRDPDTLLYVLVLELERRADAIPRELLSPVEGEFFGLVALGGFWDQPFFVNRARLAQASFLLAAGKLEVALERAGEAAELANRHGHAALGARAFAVASEASNRLERSADEALALEKGRELLAGAAEAIADPELRKGFLDRRHFLPLRRKLTLTTDGSDRRLLALYDMIRALNSETDPDALMESILDMAIEVVEAERGMILLRDPLTDEFSVTLARNLEKETIADAESYSRHIVAEAGAGKPVLTLDAGQDERFQTVKSVSLYGIRSLMCVPLRLRERIVGTVYLDSRQKGRMFNAEDLRFLEAFADHASLALENARSRARLVEENRRLRTAAEERVRFDNLVGRCAPMQRVFDLIEKSANCDLTVLIQGETGTGKELVARAIHFNSGRKKAPFVTENCAALPETLLQSELFGHVRGAFTGADRDRRGMFEQANGGTLFLDEIGDMSLPMQAQLLRVLQEGEVRRVGGDRSIRVDVRVLTATHRDLQREVEAGRFREDLMYRIQVLVIPLPPLRERPGDVALLADHFLAQIASERGQEKARISARLLAFLEEYAWPGNVRQLENALRRLSVLAGGALVDETVLEGDPVLTRMLRPSGQPARQPVLAARGHTREQIEDALRAAKGNRTRAARMLGISRATFYRKLKEHGI
jgi:Nif-specific regulatory protein